MQAKTESVPIHDVVSGVMQRKRWKSQHKKLSKKTADFLTFYRISSAGLIQDPGDHGQGHHWNFASFRCQDSC